MLFVVGMPAVGKGQAIPGSFQQKTNDYNFLQFTDVQGSHSAITGFALPPDGTNWLIQVASVATVGSADVMKVTVGQETTATGNFWAPTFLGSSPLEIGSYSNGVYTIPQAFSNAFPLPFFIPSDNVAVFNETLNATLSARFQYYGFFMFQEWVDNLTAMVQQSGGNTTQLAQLQQLLNSFPVQIGGIVYAYNGTSTWQQSGSAFSPVGQASSDVMLLGVYSMNGTLHFMRESTWTGSEWAPVYKLQSPKWALLGSLLESIFPGAPSGEQEGIPGFPTVPVMLLTTLGVAVVALQISRKKRVST